MNFNKQYWIEQLKMELGLSDVPDAELHLYYVDTGVFFGEIQQKTTAKDYIEKQLKDLEEHYNLFGDGVLTQNDDITNPGHMRNSYNESDILSRLDSAALQQSYEVPFAEPFVEKYNNSLINSNNLIQIVPQTIRREVFRYYEVFINNISYIVVFNLDSEGKSSKIRDQIKHLQSTSYFVEERNPISLTEEERIITYYQFVNILENVLRLKEETTKEKIQKEVQTVFEGGVKLDNFL
jgi:hypothetical protein